MDVLDFTMSLVSAASEVRADMEVGAEEPVVDWEDVIVKAPEFPFAVTRLSPFQLFSPLAPAPSVRRALSSKSNWLVYRRG